jgi:hypothetical protein
MPVINWVYLCDYAYMDASGKKSIIGMFEFIKVKKLPVNWPQLYVAVDLTVSVGEQFKMKVVFTSPSNQELGKVDFQMKSTKVDPGSGGKSAKIFLPFGFFNLKFSEAGEHHIEMFVDDVPIHFIPLRIIQAS